MNSVAGEKTADLSISFSNRTMLQEAGSRFFEYAEIHQKRLGRAFKAAFSIASKALDDIKPIFLEAAAYLRKNGRKYHDKHIRGLPGAKYHSMVGQSEISALVRRARSEARAFTNRILGHPERWFVLDNF